MVHRDLFADVNSTRHFAVVTNDWVTDGQSPLKWLRGKAEPAIALAAVGINLIADGVCPRHATRWAGDRGANDQLALPYAGRAGSLGGGRALWPLLRERRGGHAPPAPRLRWGTQTTWWP